VSDNKEIWHRSISAEELQKRNLNCMSETLGIVITKTGPDFLEATMPVDHRTKQNFGLLHGGASAALSETLGSLAGNLCVDTATHRCVGVEINANHVRAVTEGFVIGHTTPIHLGRTLHVWETRITDSNGKLACVSRLTLAVVPVEKLRKKS
jgi:1,4-dihydroxy-2-naphthoyl-CoA hydrolase